MPRCVDDLDRRHGDIMEWYDGLDPEQVKAVIEFAVRSLDTSVRDR